MTTFSTPGSLPTNQGYSEAYSKALLFAAENHRCQFRRNGSPYLAHLMAVSGLIWEMGGTEEQAIAGLLHDYPEDQWSDNPLVGLLIIEEKFGSRITTIVRGCTELDQAADWQTRKERYIEQVRNADSSVKRVSFADKLHNLLCSLREALSPNSTRINPKKQQGDLWFYSEMFKVFVDADIPGEYLDEYAEALDKLRTAWNQ